MDIIAVYQRGLPNSERTTSYEIGKYWASRSLPVGKLFWNEQRGFTFYRPRNNEFYGRWDSVECKLTSELMGA